MGTAGNQLSFSDVIATLDAYVNDFDGSATKNIIGSEQVHLLPFGGAEYASILAHLAALDPETIRNELDIYRKHPSRGRTLPFQIPDMVTVCDNEFHPQGYVAAKRGVYDAVAGLDNVGEAWFGDRYRYIRPVVRDSQGFQIRIKRRDGSMMRQDLKTNAPLAEKLREIDQAYGNKVRDIPYANLNKQEKALVDALKKPVPEVRTQLRKTLLDKISEAVDVNRFQADIQSIWKKTLNNVKNGRYSYKDISMQLALFKNSEPNFIMELTHKGKRWCMVAQVIDGKIGPVSNFICEASPTALDNATQTMKNMGINRVTYPSAGGGSILTQYNQTNRIVFTKRFPFASTALATEAAVGPQLPATRNALKFYIKGALGWGLFDAFLMGIRAYSEGGDRNAILWSAVQAFATSIVVGTGVLAGVKALKAAGAAIAGTQTFKAITQFIVAQGSKVAAGRYLISGLAKAGPLVLKGIPVLGWALTAWETGWTVGRLINYKIVQEFLEYEAACRPEYLFVESCYTTADGSAREKYYPITGEENFEFRGWRWKFTGPPVANQRPYNYDSVPRSMRLKSDDGGIIEYGEEVLLPSYTYPPFCRYLPNTSEDDDSFSHQRDIMQGFNDIFIMLNDLQDNTHISKTLSGLNESLVNRIESRKQSIAVDEELLLTKWAYCKTPEGGEMYWWCDRTKQSYVATASNGKLESDPKESQDAMKVIESIREQLNLASKR